MKLIKGKKKGWKLLLISIGLILCSFGWGVYQYNHILEIGEQTVPAKADVIIVLGAGVWQSGPSPALQARTKHAAELYHEELADNIIVSGGVGDFPPSEAEAMSKILQQQGIPDEAIHLEDEARNTKENIQYSVELMQENNWDSCIIVTDVFHLKRALMVAQKHPVNVFGSAAKNSILYRNEALKIRYTLREVFAIPYYQVKGLL